MMMQAPQREASPVSSLIIILLIFMHLYSMRGSSRSLLAVRKQLATSASRVAARAASRSQILIKRSFADFRGSSESSFSWFAWYSHKLDTHPITTKCISAGIISAIGNVLAQGISHYEEDNNRDNKRTNEEFHVDWKQVGRYAFLNVAFVAPVLHHWYEFINKAVPGRSTVSVLKRTFWDEFVFTPFYIPVFLGILWRMEGTSLEQIKIMTINEVPSIIVAEWVVWVPTMALTFRFVPVKFQVLVINSIGVAWQTFVSYMAAAAHTRNEKEAKEDSPEVALALETIVGHKAPHSHGNHK
jgi:peroxisomal membrane protein 2